VLAHVFLRLQKPPMRRMRDLVAAIGPDIIAREAGLTQSLIPRPGRTAIASAFLGPHPLGTAGFLGVGLPFGRIAADDLADLASSAAKLGASDLRLTPWRAILVPLPSLATARTLSARTDPNSFILDPDDPRRRIAACPGAPSCARATTPVRDDATILAFTLAGTSGSDIAIHVSGCEKGCAHPHPAAVTLVGRNGRYDLVRDGLASSPPSLRGLTVEQATQHLRGIAS
jgi:precorrin-3B synthase